MCPDGLMHLFNSKYLRKSGTWPINLNAIITKLVKLVISIVIFYYAIKVNLRLILIVIFCYALKESMPVCNSIIDYMPKPKHPAPAVIFCSECKD